MPPDGTPAALQRNNVKWGAEKVIVTSESHRFHQVQLDWR
jgi:hypothetical protein